MGSKLKPTQKRFLAELRKLGIHVQRKRCKEMFEGQRRMLELSPTIIADCLRKEFGSVEVQQAGFARFIQGGAGKCPTMFEESGILPE